MYNDYFNKPLYPNSNFQESQQKNPLFESLSGLMSQGDKNPLLSLLLGLKGGKTEGLTEMLTKSLGGGLFQNSSQSNKKESKSSPKSMPEDEFLS